MVVDRTCPPIEEYLAVPDLQTRLEDETLGVVAQVEGGRPLLVTFGGTALRFGITPFEFVQLIQGMPADVVFVRDLSQSFYQRGVPELGSTFREMARSLSSWADGASRSVFVGNSAGGYAAMILGAMCEADRVLAFAPQTFLHPWRRILFHDRRWSAIISPVNRGPACQRGYLDARSIVAAHPNVRAEVHFTEGHRLDRIHARRMRHLPNVRLRPHAGNSHTFIRSMRDSGELRGLLQRALFGDGDI